MLFCISVTDHLVVEEQIGTVLSKKQILFNQAAKHLFTALFFLDQVQVRTHACIAHTIPFSRPSLTVMGT